MTKSGTTKSGMRKTVWVCASLAGVLGVGISIGAEQVQATQSTVSTKILANSVIAPVRLTGHGTTKAGDRWEALLRTHGLTDGYVVDNKFAPGQSTGWHSHPGPSLIFVVAGTVTNYDSGTEHCAGISYPKGSNFIDEGGTMVHMLRNDGTEPAETIAVQLIPSGKARRIDKLEPAKCHK